MALTWRADHIAAPAATDMSQKEFHAGRLNSDGTIGVATTPAECLGVLRGDPVAGDTASLQHSRVIQACVGAAVNIGTQPLLVPNGAGRFVPATSGQRSVVRALSSASGDGQLVTALVGRVEVA